MLTYTPGAVPQILKGLLQMLGVCHFTPLALSLALHSVLHYTTPFLLPLSTKSLFLVSLVSDPFYPAHQPLIFLHSFASAHNPARLALSACIHGRCTCSAGNAPPPHYGVPPPSYGSQPPPQYPPAPGPQYGAVASAPAPYMSAAAPRQGYPPVGAPPQYAAPPGY